MSRTTYQFHPLVTLPFIIANGNIVFRLAVRDADHCCGLVNAALELALVAAFGWIRVFRIFPAVTGDAVRSVIAVRAIELISSQNWRAIAEVET